MTNNFLLIVCIYFYFWILCTHQVRSCTDVNQCLQCHCTNRCSNGLCLYNGRCEKGWFGLGCQYNDLATIEEASITVGRRRSSNFLKDNNDKTCDDYVADVTVSWNREYMLTWVRLVMREIKNDLNIKILFKAKGSQVFKVCSQRRIHHVSTKILDVWCLDVALVREVKIEGNLGGLCSLHISGGHNFAYKQNAVLSSNYGTDDRGDKAVDGNRDPDYSKKSCAHSGTHENYPKLTLTLSQPVVITRVVLYNRNKHEIRLMKFILQLFKKNDHLWYSYQNRSDTPLPTYTIIMSSKEQTEKMSITATEIDRQYNDKPIVTLCEVEAYGECSEGYWGLLCTNKCPKECSTNCHIENGQCNTICLGNSDLLVCQAECALGQWGINCKERCSDVCHKSSCNRISGICDQGCLGYSDPPTCRFKCSRGRWGINCLQTCSQGCLNSSCNASTGLCDKGCLGYSNPPLCTLTCSSGDWGVNCSQTCSERCYNSSCNQTNGVCYQGCLGYNDPPQCNTTCFNGLWGLNCSQTCPEKCLNSSCLATSGECDQGFLGYSKVLPHCTNSAILTESTIGAVVVVVLIVLCLGVIGFKRKKQVQKAVVDLNIVQRMTAKKSDLFTTEQSYLDEKDKTVRSCTDVDRCLQCHCTTDCSKGLCPSNGHCEKGWFGLGCQYNDLATIQGVSITAGQKRSSNFLKDETCADYVADVTVSWNREYMLTWVRLVMREIRNDLNIRILFKTKGSQVFNLCSQHRIHYVTNKILDVWCLDGVNVTEIKIDGNLAGLCSLYISGGRNFAYKQNAVLSSNYENNYGGDKAVDGNRNADFNGNSCAHSGIHENYPTLTLTLNQSVVITRVVLYNRKKHAERLLNFILQMFKKNDISWFSYQDPLKTPLSIYTILIPIKEKTEKMSIAATYIDKDYDDKPILTLCEVEAYGECPRGYWGLMCTDPCPPECRLNCHIENGQCNTICFGYSDPPLCRAECARGQWGINCTQRCSNGCYKSSCNRISGICDQGCLGYSDPPTCRSKCLRGRWGINCLQTCSQGCLNSSCNASTGHCDKGCLGYSNPPLCNLKCSSGDWGVNCSQTCSERCYNSSCNRTNGVCDQGCLGYNDPPKCKSRCSSGRWGLNCSQTCSQGCLSSSCNASTGLCDKGCLGYSNPPFCNKTCSKGRWGLNCSQTCLKKCLHSSCLATSGLCDQGCLGYSDPPVCNIACHEGVFGLNCTQNCSTNCMNGTCNDVTGFCYGCLKDYYGDFCQHFNSSLPHSSNSASVKESTIGVVIALLLIVLCLGVIGFIRRKQVQKAVMELNIVQRMTAKKSDFLTTEQNYLDEKDIADTSSEDSSDSCASQSATPLTTTTINVKDLQTFIPSKPREYFARQFKLIPTAQNVTRDVGLSEENRFKNRYKDIVTYDHSRVVLIRNDEENEEDYINASYIKGFYGDNRFIASQGPNKTMINDFVRMLWEQKTKKVVMLTNLVEDGKTKCERYWPEKGKSMFGQIKVNVISTQTFADYTIRTMQLTKGDETAHVLTQYHFTSWPDKNVPITPWSLVEFYHKVYLSPSSVPTVVHCSAGVGRTGTFIALCNIMDQAKETGKVDFFNTLSKLRQDRICMIQTVEQYVFLHKFARVALLCMGTFITQSNISERVVDLNKRINSMSKMEEEFSSLCEMCHCPDESESGNENMTEADQLYQNVKCATEQKKDRFPELAPKDCYRVHLSDINNDYIHAVYIQSYTSRDHNILTQLPLPNTVVDFWKCVVEKKISLIVTFELDTSGNDKSVAQYLPDGVEQYFLCSPVKVQSLSFKTLKMGEERKLNVTWKSGHHKVTHIKTDLKDLDPRKLLTLINQIRSYDVQGRTMFVCKNGSTFSGLACTLVTLLDRLDQEKLVSVPLVVGSVKAIRPKVIDNMAEYKTVYEVLQSYIETSSSYANVEVCNLTKFSMSRYNPLFMEDENQDENPYCNY